MGFRNSANTTESTKLTFQLIRNGKPYKASSITSLYIFRTSTGYVQTSTGYALTSTGYVLTSTGGFAAIPVEKIDNGDIVVTSSGLYSYTASTISSTGTYFDVLTLNLLGSGTTTFVNSFVVSEEFSSQVVSIEPLCTVYGYVKLGDATSVDSVKISAIPDTQPAIDSITGNAILPIALDTYTDSTGFFSINLIQNVVYRVNIREMSFYQRVMIPKAGSVELWSLSSISDVGDQPAPTGGGYVSVADQAARLAISSGSRLEGMLVKQLSDGTYWTLAGGIADGNWMKIVLSPDNGTSGPTTGIPGSGGTGGSNGIGGVSPVIPPPSW